MSAIVDLTTVYNGRDQVYLDIAIDYIRKQADSKQDVDITVVAAEGSVAPQVYTNIRPFPAAYDGDARWKYLREVLLETCSPVASSQGGGSAELLVISFREEMSDLVADINRTSERAVSFIDYRSLLFPKTAFTWPQDELPLDEALAILLHALRSEKDGYLRMSALRAALEKMDSRFEKTPTNPLSTSGVIKYLVNSAKERGLVVVYGSDQSNPFVAATSFDSVGFASARSAPPGDRETVAAYANNETVGAERLTMPLREPYSTPNANNRTNRKVSISYIETLRGADLGPYQQVRMKVYDEIEKFANEGTYAAIEVVNRAVEALWGAEEEAFSRSEGSHAKRQPWSRIHAFAVRLLAQCPCMLSDGQPIRLTIPNMAKRVDGMIDGWRLLLDSQLLLCLVDGHTVGLENIIDLSGALYNTRRDTTAITELIQYAVSSGICAADLSAGKLISGA